MRALKLFNTLPGRDEVFWQIVFLPTITLYRNVEKHDGYISLTFEWLFWSGSLLIKNSNDDKAGILDV